MPECPTHLAFAFRDGWEEDVWVPVDGQEVVPISDRLMGGL
jgi:hypothetical protein